ncbi:hypothetical protein D3C87_1773050 [compost metagenome]
MVVSIEPGSKIGSSKLRWWKCTKAPPNSPARWRSWQRAMNSAAMSMPMKSESGKSRAILANSPPSEQPSSTMRPGLRAVLISWYLRSMIASIALA